MGGRCWKIFQSNMFTLGGPRRRFSKYTQTLPSIHSCPQKAHFISSQTTIQRRRGGKRAGLFNICTASPAELLEVCLNQKHLIRGWADHAAFDWTAYHTGCAHCGFFFFFLVAHIKAFWGLPNHKDVWLRLGALTYSTVKTLPACPAFPLSLSICPSRVWTVSCSRADVRLR